MGDARGFSESATSANSVSIFVSFFLRMPVPSPRLTVLGALTRCLGLGNVADAAFSSSEPAIPSSMPKSRTLPTWLTAVVSIEAEFIIVLGSGVRGKSIVCMLKILFEPQGNRWFLFGNVVICMKTDHRLIMLSLAL